VPTPETLERLRAAYRRWDETRGASTEAWLDLIADDVTVRSIAEGSHGLKFSAPRAGRASVEQYFRDVAADWEMVFFRTEDFVAEGDRVVMIGRCAWKHRRTGRSVESAITHLWRFRGAQVVEFLEFFDTAAAAAAAAPDPK
jgi:ketosteroid isomerase-like protein